MMLFYPAGWVMDHYGRAWVAFPVVASMTVGVALLPLTHSFATILAVSVVMAIGNGLGSGIVMTMGADTAPTVGRAQFLGGWRLVGDIGGTSAPLVVAALVGPLTLAAASPSPRSASSGPPGSPTGPSTSTRGGLRSAHDR